MSRHNESNAGALPESLGTWLRELRQAKALPLRAVAAAAEMDSTLLSKIELGQRLPTEAQAKALATFFGVPLDDVEAKRITARFWQENNSNPAAAKAAAMIRESAPAYMMPLEAAKPVKHASPSTQYPTSTPSRGSHD
ncbi:MAG: helix-turn-helix transcriptional regulator [bacterium]